jgi:hypothetical protein
MTTDHKRLPAWPLMLIAAPAAVAVWSGWVGLGGLCGFGALAPLPGIAGGFRINTAITLPVGVEAYGAYALGAWLAPGAPPRARTFARRSAIGALALGMAGQVIYHLLAAAHAAAAPWPVVTLVACLPVATLGMATALTHLLHAPAGDGEDDRDDGPVQGMEPVREYPRVPAPAGTATAPVRDREPVRPRAAPPAYGDRRTGPAGHGGEHPGSHTAGPAPRGEVDRAAVVAGLAGQIRAATEAGQRWRPDYATLMARTGRRRSWCEKAVRDARTAASRPAVPAPATRTGHPDGTATMSGRTGQPAPAPGPGEPARTGRPALHATPYPGEAAGTGRTGLRAIGTAG